MSSERLTRNFILLRALRWLPVGLVLPFLILTPVARGLELGAVGAVFAVHSAVLIVLEVPSGALADSFGRRRVLLVGAALTAASLGTFAVAQSVLAFMACAAAALVYLAAVAALVQEPAHEAHLHDAGHSVARRIRMVFATARAEIAASITVRVIFATAVAFGFAMSAVELLWQPHLAQELGGDTSHGFKFGALAAGSMPPGGGGAPA